MNSPEAPAPQVAEELGSKTFQLQVSNGTIVSLRRVDDAHDTDYIYPGASLGDLAVRCRKGTDEWIEIDTSGDLPIGVTARPSLDSAGGVVGTTYSVGGYLTVTSTFTLSGDDMLWSIGMKNESEQAVEISDLGFPLLFNSRFMWNEPPEKSVLRHGMVSGHASFLFWMRPNSAGPYLLMTPQRDAKLEYFDTPGHQYRVFVHSAGEGIVARSHGCRWRQRHTGLVLQPNNSDCSEKVYTFRFQWVDDYDAVRNALVDNGGVDCEVVPGMTLPSDFLAKFTLRTKQEIKAVVPEYPDQTTLTYLGEKDGLNRLYEVKFDKLGENSIRVEYGECGYQLLEFFVTEPLETLIRKRSAFLVKSQVRDEEKWYNGLLQEWNMESHVLLNPDNYDRIKGWRIYEVTCDDPALGKAPYVATKNLEFPDQNEIEAIDYYIKNFVWGGLQCTDDEPYPFGIYGIPDWKTLRESKDPGRKGKQHIWRIYDYPHIFLLYLRMYQIARTYPHIKMYLPKEEYLRRAYRTAVAMFTIPLEVGEWTAYETGLYNELVIDEILQELEEAGQTEEAATLREHWEKKIKFFVAGRPSLFGSEYPFDSTGFESTHAFARYALEHCKQGSGQCTLDISREQAERFMWEQTEANLFCRGWLENSYYLLGSDFRGSSNAGYTLSYMAQMAGWSLLDYALYHSTEPHKYLRLAYASYLSSWALMNTGTQESNYGYWYPGPENDGAAGGGFEPAPYGETWLDQPHHRGSWYYSCEIDLGYNGALRCAATVLADDPLFGLTCYGGKVTKNGAMFNVIAADGVRRRFHAVLGDRKLHVLLDGAHFSSSTPVSVNESLDALSFTLEASHPEPRDVQVSLSGLPEGRYSVVAGDESMEVSMGSGETVIAVRVVPSEQGTPVRVERA